MRPDFSSLALFIRIAETRSITKAAEACHIALAAASRRVAQLEDQFGVQLLYRTAQGVELAPAGHALLFHASASRTLGRRAAAHFEACERQQALLYVPMAVIWEVSLLARASRINLRRPIRDFFGDLFSNPAYHAVDLTSEHVYLADELRFTRDPFDALIVAAARTLALPLLTRDADIRSSGAVRVIW